MLRRAQESSTPQERWPPRQKLHDEATSVRSPEASFTAPAFNNLREPEPPRPVGACEPGNPPVARWTVTQLLGTSDQQQRMQEELAREKVRVERERAAMQQRLQRQQLPAAGNVTPLNKAQPPPYMPRERVPEERQQHQHQPQRFQDYLGFNQQLAALAQRNPQVTIQQLQQQGGLPVNGGGGLGPQNLRLPGQSLMRRCVDPTSEAEVDRRGTGSSEVCDMRTRGRVTTSLPGRELLKEFEALYAEQSDGATVEHLRKQEVTKHGVLGTIDVDFCMQMIEENDVTIVVTDTGTGKSTLIPKAIFDKHSNAIVANAQPRRTSAINLAKRVSKMYGEEPGKKVGYWVRGEHVGMIGETPIMYLTNYSLFLYLLHTQPDDIGVTHVIFDEFHERTTEVEVLLLLMKLVILRYPGKLKLILCSATADASKWKCFFENLKVGEYSKANIMYPVHEYHLEDVCKLINMAFVEPSISDFGIVESLQLHSIILMVRGMLTLLAKMAQPEHSILVFVPGRTVVEQLCIWVQSNLSEQLEPVPWYRDIQLDYIQKEMERKSERKKKVYIATDIAEVSLTLPDVVFVIDSGTSKRPFISSNNMTSVAFPPLQLLWESSVNMIQRRGRIGRVQQGFFFTMLSSKQVDSLSQDDSRLGNSVLHEVVLHSLYLTYSPFLIFSMCREKPRKESVELSLSTLRDSGCIVLDGDNRSLIKPVRYSKPSVRREWSKLLVDAYNSQVVNGNNGNLLNSLVEQQKYELTLRGLIVGSLPFNIWPGAIVYNGLIMGMTTLSIIAASCVSCGTPFYIPYDVQDKRERAKHLHNVEEYMRSFKGEYHNDTVSAVGVVIDYMEMNRKGYSEEGEKLWCEKHYVTYSRIKDILLAVEQAKEQLYGVIPFDDITDVDELKKQYDENALALSFICSAAYVHQAIYVLFEPEVAAKTKYAGSGLFINVNCNRDRSVPTTCSWDKNTICIPFNLQTTYSNLLGSLSSQLNQEAFNIILLLFSSIILHEDVKDYMDTVTFEVNHNSTSVFIATDRITAQKLLQLRRIFCARLCTLDFLMNNKDSGDDTAGIANHLHKMGVDFGVQPEKINLPEFLLMLIKTIKNILGEVEGANNSTTPRPFFCRPTEPPANFHPTHQSTLTSSGNGCGSYERPVNEMQPNYSQISINFS